VIHAGRLRHRVGVQTRTLTQTSLGTTESLSAEVVRWAAVNPLPPRVRMKYAQREVDATHELVFRGSVTVTVGETRFRWKGRYLVPAEPAMVHDGRTTVIAREAPEEGAPA